MGRRRLRHWLLHPLLSVEQICQRQQAVAELVTRQEKSNLGLGGVLFGYAAAKAANVPPDEIFANKADNKTWAEVMRARQVSVASLQQVFEGQ